MDMFPSQWVMGPQSIYVVLWTQVLAVNCVGWVGFATDLALIDSCLLSFCANALRSSDPVFTRLATIGSGERATPSRWNQQNGVTGIGTSKFQEYHG